MDLPVFLINLDGSDQRLKAASAQLGQSHISFQRVPAFDGRRLTIDEFPDYDPLAAMKYMGRPMRGGEIGCYLSHLDCARRFLDSGAGQGVVLEDDMQLMEGFEEGVGQILEWLSTGTIDWDVINIGPNRHKIYTPLFSFTAGKQLRQLTHAHYFPMTTTGLIWSRKGATAFVSEHRRIWCAVDNYLRHWQTRTDRGLAVWPPLVTTTGAESEIAHPTQRRRSVGGRHPLYGLIKQRRLLTDKFIAWQHKRRVGG